MRSWSLQVAGGPSSLKGRFSGISNTGTLNVLPHRGPPVILIMFTQLLPRIASCLFLQKMGFYSKPALPPIIPRGLFPFFASRPNPLVNARDDPARLYSPSPPRFLVPITPPSSALLSVAFYFLSVASGHPAWTCGAQGKKSAEARVAE